MKKRILTAVMAFMAAVTMTLPIGSIKSEAKWEPERDFECEGYYPGVYNKGNCKAETCGCYTPMTRAQKQEVLGKVRPILAAAPSSAHEKVKYFHDIICKSAEYSLNYKYEIASPYGVLIQGKAKCLGYAETFRMLCDVSKIPCYEISGYYDGTAHSWNIVQLEDGEWYELDCTFDDETSSYKWFLLTTKQMSSDHKRDSSMGQLEGRNVIANGTLYAYNKKAVKAGNAKYKVTDTGKVEYTEPTKSAKGNISIPDTVTIGNTSYEITSIAKNAFKGNKKIKKVVIGKNIETIGSAAFSNCPNLKSVDMSKCKVNTLSKNLFKGSKKLSKLSLNGDNVTSVGKNALKGISRKCKISISHENDSCASLVKGLKKQGAKNCTFNIR